MKPAPRVVPPRDLPISERDLQHLVLEVGELYGWARAHFRPAMTDHGWRTPVQGDGKGFPDLILVRPPRLIAAELKSKAGRLEAAQAAWLDLFAHIPGVEVYIWRPGDIDDILRILRR